MNAADAMNALLRALDQIDKLAEVALNDGDDSAAWDAVEEIHSITGSLIGDLARAGFESR